MSASQRAQDAAARARRGAGRGAFTHQQRQALLDAVHRGAVAGVTGADPNDDTAAEVYEYEEAAHVPVQFAPLPPARARYPAPAAAAALRLRAPNALLAAPRAA